MSGEKTSKGARRGRPKKKAFKSLFSRHGTESQLEKANDAYDAYVMGDHLVSSSCREHKMPMQLGLKIQEATKSSETVGNITIRADVLVKHGTGITALTKLMLEHRRNLSTPTLQRKVQRAALDIMGFFKEKGAVNLKCAAEQITGENLSSRNSTVNNAMSVLLHHYSG